MSMKMRNSVFMPPWSTQSSGRVHGHTNKKHVQKWDKLSICILCQEENFQTRKTTSERQNKWSLHLAYFLAQNTFLGRYDLRQPSTWVFLAFGVIFKSVYTMLKSVSCDIGFLVCWVPFIIP